MFYSEYETLMSRPRMLKYLTGCGNDARKAMVLYRANIYLSQNIFSVMCLFEVALRNAIDRHYKGVFGNNWLYDAAQPGGFLQAKGCEKSLEGIKDVIIKLGASYSHDRAIAELAFGFWTYQFSSKQFAAAGSTLLNIFPQKPFGVNHTDVFKRLVSIIWMRNRIAHHEPICFGPLFSISSSYAEHQYNQIKEMLQWLGINTTSFLFGVDYVPNSISYIDSIV